MTLRSTVREIYADLLEIRLYFDEPTLIWRAQLSLVRHNLNLFVILLPPLLIFAALWAAFLQSQPRPSGPAVLTIQMDRPPATTDDVELRGADVDSPPVRIMHDNQIAWRLRASGRAIIHPDLTVNGSSIGHAKFSVGYTRTGRRPSLFVPLMAISTISGILSIGLLRWLKWI